MPHATAQQWSTSPTTSQPTGGGIYNPASTDLYNNPRYGYVGVGVMRPRAKLHIHECTFNQFVTGSGTGLVNGLVGQLQGIYTDLTTHTTQLNADYKLITPATPEQGNLLYAFASRVDSLRGAYEHFYQTVQASRLPPGTPEQMTACTGSASVYENTQTTLEATIQTLRPTVDTLPGIQSYLTTLTTFTTTGANLRTVGNQLIQTIFANSSLNRSLSCNSLPAGSTSPTSNVQLLLTNEHSPKVTTQPNGITVPSQGLLMGLARDVGYVFNQIGTGMYFLTAGGSQPAIAIDRVAGEGRVGINVTDPLATLDVRGTSFRLGPNGPSALRVTHEINADLNPLIRFKSPGADHILFDTRSLNISDRILLGPDALTGAVDLGSRLDITQPSSNPDAFITCNTSNTNGSLNEMFWVSNVGRAYIANHTRIDGRLGIGISTATPAARLHVRFSANDVANAADAGTGLILDRANTASGSPTPMRNRISFRINNAETWAMGVDPDNTGEQQFFIGAFSSTPLRIHQSGRVAIGATTAELNASATQYNTALLVKGTTRVDGLLCAKEVRVRLQGGACWPDYVFDPDYKLRTLGELKAYVAEHRHLPGLPAADTMETQGLDLGETLRQLTLNLEELTLQVIHLKEELNRCQTR